MVYIYRYGASTSQHGKLLTTLSIYWLWVSRTRLFGTSIPWTISGSYKSLQTRASWFFDGLIPLRVYRFYVTLLCSRVSRKSRYRRKRFDRIIKSVLNVSGYFGSATVHAIRRYLGKKVNGKLFWEKG